MQQLVPARLLAALRPDAATPVELPGDLARESRRRVRVAAALGTLAYAVFLAVELSRLVGGTAPERAIDLAHDAIGLSLCASLLLVSVLRPIGDRTVLGIALAVEVALSGLISVAVPWAGFIRTAHVGSLTWVVPIIILFPLLVPAPPTTALGVSILCALTMPAGLALLASRGLVVAQLSDFWGTSISGAVAVAIATVASRVVYGAGRQVAAARRVGSYELIERLGQGGMGEVWKARHLMLARPAAVKLILPERMQGPSEEREMAVKRFTREAQVTASLRSPHTVELFDFGMSANGTFYYAMELLEGMNAEHFVYRFGPIEPRRAVSWLRQMCHSLGEAHASDLVHRDIKPSNVFLCRFGRDVDFVKVLDFGLTRPVAAAEDGGLTSPGMLLGTPAYMAPEQIFGLPADSRTDLYALGCLGYFLLAGKKPFEAESAGEMLRQHAHATPPPLAGRTPRPVPGRLEAVIMACLSKDPADRPRDADALCDALGESLDGETWSEADARDWWKQNLNDA